MNSILNLTFQTATVVLSGKWVCAELGACRSTVCRGSWGKAPRGSWEGEVGVVEKVITGIYVVVEHRRRMEEGIVEA